MVHSRLNFLKRINTNESKKKVYLINFNKLCTPNKLPVLKRLNFSFTKHEKLKTKRVNLNLLYKFSY